MHASRCTCKSMYVQVNVHEVNIHEVVVREVIVLEVNLCVIVRVSYCMCKSMCDCVGKYVCEYVCVSQCVPNHAHLLKPYKQYSRKKKKRWWVHF